MKVKKNEIERRSGKDRRQSLLLYDGQERRSKKERRKNIEELLKFLIEQSEKEEIAKKQKKSVSGTGNVIRRRKGEIDKRIDIT